MDECLKIQVGETAICKWKNISNPNAALDDVERVSMERRRCFG